MASKWPPVKNSAYTFRCVLFAQADKEIKANPTIAAGDWKVSTDGAAFANLATLPDVDPDSSVQVLVSLSAGEMNGDEIMVTAIDAAGDEWHSAAFVIHTAGQTLDTMDANIDSVLEDTGTTLPGTLTTIDGIVDDILTDTGTTLPATLATIGGYIDTEVASVLAAVDTEVAAILADTNELQGDWADGGRLDLILDARASQTSVDDVPTNSELTTALAAADDAVLAAITALNNLSAAQVNAEVVDALQTDTISDSYAADGAQPTIAQAILEIRQYLLEREVDDVTVTVMKPDGTTPAYTLTLNSATTPTSITRAS